MTGTGTTTEHPNAALVRRAHEAFETGDMDVVHQVFDPDIRWVMPGRSQVSGVDEGLEEVFRNFAKTVELTDGTYRAVGVDYLGSDGHAVALTHLTAERNGTRIDIGEAVIFTVVDGRLTEAFHLPYDQYAWDEFFG